MVADAASATTTVHRARVVWEGGKLWFLSLSRARRLRVTSYEDAAEGTMDGTRFTRVALRPRIEWEEAPDQSVIDELHHEAHERCFIANSVNFPVEVEPA